MQFALDIQAPELPELLADLDGIDEWVLDEMARTMRRSVDVVEQAVVQRTPVGATSNLRGGWGTDVERGLEAVKGTVATAVDYAPYVERGRGPGKWPPHDPIELWVKRVLGIRDERELAQVTFLVRRAIGRRGVKGVHMAEKGLEAVKPLVLADFNAIPERVARRVERE